MSATQNREEAVRTQILYGAPAYRIARLDRHTRLFLWMVKAAIKNWKSSTLGIDRVRPPLRKGGLVFRNLPFGAPGKPIRVPVNDEDWPTASRNRDIFLRILRVEALFPVHDTNHTWKSRAEARDVFQELLPQGVYLSRPYHFWEEMDSDSAASRLAFAGLGGYRTTLFHPDGTEDPRVANARWVSDFSYLGNYDVRPGFERYGAKALFDPQQRPMAIWWCHGKRWVFPTDAEWAHAKWAWRSSMMVGSTVTDHLVFVHWIMGNTVTVASRMSLQPTHYISLLLKAFTWRTITINYGASNSLLPKCGFVHRASALTYEALVQALTDSVGLARFQSVPALVAEKGADQPGVSFPWATEALELYKVIRSFVEDYLATYTTPEEMMTDPELKDFWMELETAPPPMVFPTRSYTSLVDILSQFIWTVTGLHEAVGTIHEYVLDPTFMGTKLRSGTETSDVQASIQYLLILALTGLEMPALLDIGDCKDIFSADYRGRGVFARFSASLRQLVIEMDGRNEQRLASPHRPWPCQSFNPRHLETAVSI
jgi:Lipoxygenase